MLNFVYCFDENYNSQALTSINSLTDHATGKINLFIIHENPETFNDSIINKEKLESLNIYHIVDEDIDFPNLSGTHVSKATYYRFYMSKYLPDDLDYIIYIDADIVCLNDPIQEFNKHIDALKKSKKHLVARTETLKSEENLVVNPFTNLQMKSEKYFNAGLMIIDYQYWKNENIESNLFEIMNRHYQDIIFWDQDVLNKFFDGDYLELNNLCNYGFGIYAESEYDEENILGNVIFLHYTGKGKPWDVNFILIDSSKIFQKYYQKLGLKKYLLSQSNSIKGSRQAYIKNIFSLKFLKLEYPFRYLIFSSIEIFKIKKLNLSNKKIIYERQTVIRKKPINLELKDSYLFQHEYKKHIPASYIYNIKNPLIINNSIFNLKKFRIYTKETFYENHTYSKKIKDTFKNLIKSKKGIKNLPNGIWILDTKSENFGHWMIDAICRYQLVHRNFKSYPILLPERFDIVWITEMLDHLGYSYVVLSNNIKYRVNNLILTSRAHPSGNYNPLIVNELRDLFLEDHYKSEYNESYRIWADREQFRRKVHNFNEIEHILKKHNFKIIQTEKLSLLEKINLFSRSEIISGTHGSGLINLFFMNKNSKIFEVRDLNDTLKNAVFSLASALGINYFYMERKESHSDGGSIDPVEFEEKLINCINS
jgi:lipopolysaccharide biosynthesis glycosyltransferase